MCSDLFTDLENLNACKHVFKKIKKGDSYMILNRVIKNRHVQLIIFFTINLFLFNM